jgi:hypothetical protein
MAEVRLAEAAGRRGLADGQRLSRGVQDEPLADRGAASGRRRGPAQDVHLPAVDARGLEPGGALVRGQDAGRQRCDGVLRSEILILGPPAIVSQVRVVVGARADRAELHGAAVLARYNMFGHDLLALGGAVGGFIVTLCYLGSMDFQPVPGCGPQGATVAQLPDRCFALAEGYPLRFLSADQNIPVINKSAMARDWVQWTLVSWSVLYLTFGSYRSAPVTVRNQLPEPGEAELLG